MRIPEYQSKGAPTPQARSTAAVGGAIYSFGNDIQKAGRVYDMANKAAKQSSLSNALAYSSVERMKAKAAIERNPSGYNTAEETYAGEEKRIDDYVKKNHADVYGEWKGRDIEEATRSNLGVKSYVTKMTIDKIGADSLVQMDAWSNYATDKGTEEARIYATKQYADSLSRDFAAGAISQEEAQANITKFGQQVAEGKLTRDVRENPEATISKLKAGAYTGISAKKKQEWIDKATAEAQAQYATSVRDKEKSASALEKQLKQDKEDNAIEITRNVSESGVIDMPTLRDMLSKHQITREFFNSMEKQEIEGPQKSHPDEYNRYRGSATSGYMSVKDLTANPFISSADKIRLIDLNSKAQDSAFSEQIGRGKDLLKSVIITTGPMAPFAKGERERLSNAEDELEHRLSSGEEYRKVIEDMETRYRTESTKTLKSLPILRIPGVTVRPQTAGEIQAARKAIFISVNSKTSTYSDMKYNTELLERYDRLISIGAK